MDVSYTSKAHANWRDGNEGKQLMAETHDYNTRQVQGSELDNSENYDVLDEE
jgi:hypothetical protein